MEASLLHIKAAPCGRLTKPPSPSECVCVCVCLWYDYRGLLAFICRLSVTPMMSLSYITFLSDISVKPQYNASKNWTEPFQEFQLHPFMITGSTSWGRNLPKAPLASVLPPKDVKMKIFYHWSWNNYAIYQLINVLKIILQYFDNQLLK